eukprot:TRINITY_DN15050_c0_g1_i1.p2 TRINITY_DN15050_c0_g1~~TRINITY_DN15050_c0_g1_i1.p2  ORF type:complete len:56 (-),score=13.53 TRINITY_DN15050_c0_g1_i1:28-195(-)
MERNSKRIKNFCKARTLKYQSHRKNPKIAKTRNPNCSRKKSKKEKVTELDVGPLV